MNLPQLENYVVKEPVGEGATGRVYAAESNAQPGMPVAVKVLLPAAINRQLIFDGLSKVLNHPQHPAINPVHDFDLAGAHPFIVTALQADRVQLDNGNEYWQPRILDSICGTLDPEHCWSLLTEIAEGLAHLHRLRVPHCGLSTTNVLLAVPESSGGRIRISNFCQGLVAGINSILPGESSAFAAPEQLRAREEMHEGQAERWDVYAFGVIAFRLLSGQFPRLGAFIEELRRRRAANPGSSVRFDLNSLANSLVKQVNVQWPTSPLDTRDEARRNLVISCLAIDPEQRPVDMREVVDLLTEINGPAQVAPSVPKHAEMAPDGHPRDEEQPAKRRRGLFLPIFSAVSALIALLLGISALRDGGAAGLFRALVQRPGVTPADQGTNPSDPGKDPPPPAAPDPSAYVPVAEVEELKARVEHLTEDLRVSGESVDEVFNALVVRDTTGEALYSVPEGALGSLLSYYEEFAEQHADDPTLADDVARANNNAGEIKIALGDPTQAIDNYKAAIAKIQDLWDDDPEDGTLLYNLAFYTQNLAVAQTMARLPRAALETAGKAAEHFKLLDERNNSPGSQRSLVQSFLQLSESMIDLGQASQAGLILDKAATMLGGLENTTGENESDIATLSRIDFERARIEKQSGNTEDAINLLIAATDRLLDPLLKAQPESSIYRFRLAECYAGLTDLVAASGSPQEAREANDQAMGLLVELTEEAPDKTLYRHRLAQRFTALAQLERDAGKNPEALAAIGKAISLLEDLVTHTPEKAAYSFDLAQTRSLQSDLFSEGKKEKEAFEAADLAASEMNDLYKDDFDPENNDNKRPAYRKALADLCGRLGGHLELAGKKSDARAQYDKAFRLWETLSTDPEWSENEQVKSGLARMKEKLDKLPPPE
jgi:tetratricopeptide (TPR) repeat protein